MATTMGAREVIRFGSRSYHASGRIIPDSSQIETNPLTLSLRERKHRIWRCDESRRSGFAKAQRTVLPLLGERAGVRGKRRSANQRAGELPMESTTLSERKQSSTPANAGS